MVTDDMTKTQFVVDILNRDVSNVFEAQRLIAEKSVRLQGKALREKKMNGKIGERTGRLLNSVRNPNFTVAGIDGQFQVQAFIPLHMRFLDMKKHGNWMIYNRPLYGILHGRTQFDLKYGYGRQISDALGYALKEAFKNN